MVSTVQELEACIGAPNIGVKMKTIDHMEDHATGWIAAAPLLSLITRGKDGRVRATLGGGDPGFASATGPNTLTIKTPSLDRIDDIAARRRRSRALHRARRHRNPARCRPRGERDGERNHLRHQRVLRSLRQGADPLALLASGASAAKRRAAERRALPRPWHGGRRRQHRREPEGRPCRLPHQARRQDHCVARPHRQPSAPTATATSSRTTASRSSPSRRDRRKPSNSPAARG